MVKRTYFMSVKKAHNDGNGSYSFQYCTGTLTSLFPRPEKVFRDMLDKCKEDMTEKPDSTLEVVAFNRC